MNNHLKAARFFAKLMDNQFSFLGIGFGLDNILGIVPVGGDLLSMLLSLYLIWIGIEMKVPLDKLALMISNVLIDTLIGSLPIIGDIGDILFKANIKNLRILEDFASNGNSREGVIEGEVIRE